MGSEGGYLCKRCTWSVMSLHEKEWWVALPPPELQGPPAWAGRLLSRWKKGDLPTNTYGAVTGYWVYWVSTAAFYQ